MIAAETGPGAGAGVSSWLGSLTANLPRIGAGAGARAGLLAGARLGALAGAPRGARELDGADAQIAAGAGAPAAAHLLNKPTRVLACTLHISHDFGTCFALRSEYFRRLHGLVHSARISQRSHSKEAPDQAHATFPFEPSQHHLNSSYCRRSSPEPSAPAALAAVAAASAASMLWEGAPAACSAAASASADEPASPAPAGA